MAKKTTHEEFKEKVFNLVGDEYEVLSEYVNNSTKVIMRHSTCGHEYPVTPSKFTSSGNRCPKCSRKRVKRIPEKEKSLGFKYPESLSMWHSTLNGDLTPFDVFAGSDEYVWWQCLKNPNHEWERSPESAYNRKNSKNTCPYCTGRKVCETNCLSYTHPKLAEEWDYEKNSPLTPNNITHGMNKQYWWICKKNSKHSWPASPNNRSKDKGCPFCKNRRIDETNCLSTTHPDIAKQWHATKNGNLTPNDVTFGSDRKVWWVCEKDKQHYWSATIGSRTNQDTGCPICVNQRLLIGVNDLKSQYPELVEEWDYEKNKKLDPENVTVGSDKHVHWKCSKGHEWRTTIRQRTQDKTKCPYCTNRKVWTGFNDLATKCPGLLEEWDFEQNKKKSPDRIVYTSREKVWWKCKNNHTWKTQVYLRYHGTQCPYCTNRKVWTGFNDLATKCPELLKEWDFEKNKKESPDKILYGSHKKAWWKCKNNEQHSWKASIINRYRLDRGCPQCNESKGEKKIRSFLLQNSITFRNQYRFEDCKDKNPLPFDFAIFNPNSELYCVIEYDGEQHYKAIDCWGGEKALKRCQKRDEIKNKYCKKNGITLIRIPYWDFENIEAILTTSLEKLNKNN